MNKSKKNTENRRKKSAITELIVDESCGLLEFLLKNLTKMSRNSVKSLLSRRQVMVDNHVMTQFDYSLKSGQKVSLLAQPIYRKDKQDILLDILYEDDDLIVINKPAGLLSIASDKEKEHTAYHMLTEYVKQSDPTARIFVVHRLDRDTSGILMVTKNDTVKYALQDNWASLVTQRGYMAVVEGHLAEKTGRVRSWLRETKTMMMYSSYTPGDGLEAITSYEVISENDEYSMLKIQLETGRKNQIRVHMNDLGSPIVGDKKYGSRKNPINRLALHAYKLELKHPFSGEILKFETAIPPKFKAILKKTTR